MSKFNPETVCPERAEQARRKIQNLQEIIERLETMKTWPAAGSLGHINETLEGLLNGFDNIPHQGDGPRS